MSRRFAFGRAVFVRTVFVWIAAFLMSPGAALAETVLLKNGGILEGAVSESEQTVEVRTSDGVTTFSKSDVDKIHRKSSPSKIQDTAQSAGSNLTRPFRAVASRVSRFIRNVRSTVAGWLRPVRRSKEVVAREKATNDALLQVQQALKDIHKRDRKVSKTRREMKMQGLEW